MTSSRNALSAFALTLAATSAAGAQASSTQASKIATRMLPAASATTTDTIMSVAAVRQLPNGNVLVNDQTRRRLSMFDKDMKFVSVIADSTTSTNNAYGVQPGGLLAYRGDSTLFVEPAGLSMLVIDPAGKIVRTMAAPRANDVRALLGGNQGWPGFDADGRLVYRAPFQITSMRAPQPGQPFMPPIPPDSAVLVRFDLNTRKLDSLGFFKTPKINMSITQTANGGMSMTSFNNPLPVVDDWAVMSDGTVAIVRGQDYHVDFFDASKKLTEGDKIPYEWQRMNDEDKTKFLDSAKVAIEAQQKAMRAQMAAGGPVTFGGPGGGPVQFGGPGGAGAAGAERMVMTIRGGIDGGGGGGNLPARGAAPAGAPGNIEIPPVQMVPISDLPDYKPVFGPGSVRPDMDGRLWVRTIPTKVIAGTLYEVIDGAGKLVDRVQVPPNSTIAGFGKGGIVYLGVRDASGLKLQRISLKPTTVGDVK